MTTHSSTLRRLPCGLALAGVLVFSAASAQPQTSGPFSGQRAFGQSTVEPAVNDADGSTVFLLTPNHPPLPLDLEPTGERPDVHPYVPVGLHYRSRHPQLSAA